MASFRVFPCSLQKLSSAGEQYTFVNMFTISVLPHSYWHVTLELSLYVTPLHFQFLTKIPTHFFPIYSDSTTVIFGLSKSGDEMKLSMKSLCSTCSILAISSVIVTCDNITVKAAHILALPNIPQNYKTCAFLFPSICASLVYRMHQNKTAKLQEWIPHIERQKKSV
jgi:hypothetical protein